MGRCKQFFCTFLFLSALCFSQVAAAQESGGIFISEVMWNGSESSTADEWVELYNSSDNVVDLSGFSIYDEVAEHILAQIDEGQIAPKGHFLISNNSKEHQFSKGKSILDIEPDIINSDISLSNSNFKISLRSQDQSILDVAGNTGKPFFFDYKSSSFFRVNYGISGDNVSAWSVYQSTPDGACTFSSNLDLDARGCATPSSSGRPIIKSVAQSQTYFPFDEVAQITLDFEVVDSDKNLAWFEITVLDISETTKYTLEQRTVYVKVADQCPSVKIKFFDDTGLFASKNLELNCYESSNDVWISEILPHPKEADFNRDGTVDVCDEFIEIVNSGDRPIDLSSWYLSDRSGKTYVFPEMTIAPMEYIATYKSDSGIAINDAGDSITLFSPDGLRRDEVILGSSSSKSDISFSKWAGKWVWSKRATPFAENVVIELGSFDNPTRENLVEAIGKEFNLSGKVIETERTSFAIDYEGSRIDVILSGDKVPELGQSVALSGIVSGGRYIELYPTKMTVVEMPKKTASNNQPSQLDLGSPISIAETIVYKKKNKTITKYKDISSAIRGVNTKKGLDPSKIPEYMIYLSGLFSFLLIILVYEFCCRE